MLARVATTVRALSLAAITALVLGALAAFVAIAASPVSSRYQLRGHLPELGESPTIRVFQTALTYDAYRNSLGEANVFPPASSLFMSFDNELLVLYSRGNDSGGRCLATTVSSTLDGDAVRMELGWQSGTCGAPISAHYPFILVALARTAADGTSWVTPSRPVCASAPGVSGTPCAAVGGTATAAPTTSPRPAPTASPSPAPTATLSPTPPPTATRTLTPTVPAATSPVAAASPSPTVAPTATTRSPAAAASPPQVAGTDTASNYLLYGMLIAIGFLVGIALMLSRGGSRRR